jgi:hypothetical protein
MFLNCLGKDQNVIQVDDNNAFGNEFPKDIIHHGLERSRAIGQAEKHHKWFEEASIGSEGCLELVSFLYSDIVEAPPNIHFGKVSGASKLGDQFRDEGKWIFVLDCDRIECPVVLDESESSILFFEKEELEI